MNKVYIYIRRDRDYYNNDNINTNIRATNEYQEIKTLDFIDIWDSIFRVKYLDFRKTLSIVLMNIINSIGNISIIDNNQDFLKQVFNKNDIIYATDDDDIFSPRLIDFLQEIPNIDIYNLITWNSCEITLENKTRIIDSNIPIWLPSNSYANIYGNKFYSTWSVISHITAANIYNKNQNKANILHNDKIYSFRCRGFWSLTYVYLLIKQCKNHTKDSLYELYKNSLPRYKIILENDKKNINNIISCEHLRKSTSKFLDITLECLCL